ncbi:hypothetical protein METHB2_40068 [Candidatus Methylobacter favarea]|uniref:Uncharacterized protein n=1 Tax=Candidatus Methylobacter favarea TaxID=2707345 RepID=A0A8S0XJE9_9GAMM|nr:hypothetical protein METHB2_40068 [Candidatus Methylobacter favarea]
MNHKTSRSELIQLQIVAIIASDYLSLNTQIGLLKKEKEIFKNIIVRLLPFPGLKLSGVKCLGIWVKDRK